MKWFYNLKFNRLFACITACLLLCFSCFGLFDFSTKDEPIQASAETLEQAQAETKYYFKVPAGSVFTVAASFDRSFEDLYLPSCLIGFEGDIIYTGIDGIYSGNCYAPLFLNRPESFFYTQAFIVDVLSYNSIRLVVDYYLFVSVLPISSFELTEVLVFSGDYLFGFLCSYELSSPIEVVAIQNSGNSGASQEELAQARQEGYDFGYSSGEFAGKVLGRQEGSDNLNSSIAGKDIFENAVVTSVVNEETGQSLGISMAFEPFKYSSSLYYPIYKLYATNTSSLPKRRYRVTIQFKEFVNYSIVNDKLVDCLLLDTGVVAGADDDYSMFSDIRGTFYLPNSSDSYVGCDMSFGEFDNKTGTYPNTKAIILNERLSDKMYLSAISFTVDGAKVNSANNLGYFSTENYFNDFFLQYEVGYVDGNRIGYNNGYSTGEFAGKTAGYTQGLTEGLKNAELGSFLNLATSVIDAPIKSFLGLVDFEILGMNMRVFFLSLLTGALVIAAFRLFSGGKA